MNNDFIPLALDGWQISTVSSGPLKAPEKRVPNSTDGSDSLAPQMYCFWPESPMTSSDYLETELLGVQEQINSDFEPSRARSLVSLCGAGECSLTDASRYLAEGAKAAHERNSVPVLLSRASKYLCGSSIMGLGFLSARDIGGASPINVSVGSSLFGVYGRESKYSSFSLQPSENRESVALRPLEVEGAKPNQVSAFKMEFSTLVGPGAEPSPSLCLSLGDSLKVWCNGLKAESWTMFASEDPKSDETSNEVTVPGSEEDSALIASNSFIHIAREPRRERGLCTTEGPSRVRRIKAVVDGSNPQSVTITVTNVTDGSAAQICDAESGGESTSKGEMGMVDESTTQDANSSETCNSYVLGFGDEVSLFENSELILGLHKKDPEISEKKDPETSNVLRSDEDTTDPSSTDPNQPDPKTRIVGRLHLTVDDKIVAEFDLRADSTLVFAGVVVESTNQKVSGDRSFAAAIRNKAEGWGYEVRDPIGQLYEFDSGLLTSALGRFDSARSKETDQTTVENPGSGEELHETHQSDSSCWDSLQLEVHKVVLVANQEVIAQALNQKAAEVDSKATKMEYMAGPFPPTTACLVCDVSFEDLIGSNERVKETLIAKIVHASTAHDEYVHGAEQVEGEKDTEGHSDSGSAQHDITDGHENIDDQKSDDGLNVHAVESTTDEGRLSSTIVPPGLSSEQLDERAAQTVKMAIESSTGVIRRYFGLLTKESNERDESVPEDENKCSINQSETRAEAETGAGAEAETEAGVGTARDAARQDNHRPAKTGSGVRQVFHRSSATRPGSAQVRTQMNRISEYMQQPLLSRPSFTKSAPKDVPKVGSKDTPGSTLPSRVVTRGIPQKGLPQRGLPDPQRGLPDRNRSSIRTGSLPPHEHALLKTSSGSRPSTPGASRVSSSGSFVGPKTVRVSLLELSARTTVHTVCPSSNFKLHRFHFRVVNRSMKSLRCKFSLMQPSALSPTARSTRRHTAPKLCTNVGNSMALVAPGMPCTGAMDFVASPTIDFSGPISIFAKWSDGNCEEIKVNVTSDERILQIHGFSLLSSSDTSVYPNGFLTPINA